MMHRAGVAPADAASLLGHRLGTHLAFYVRGGNVERGVRVRADACLGSWGRRGAFRVPGPVPTGRPGCDLR
jgi:hypothetical protein